MEKNEKVKFKKYFDPKFKPDIVPECRSKVIRNYHNRYAPDMLSYYHSKYERIKTWTPDIFEEIEELMEDEDTTLRGKGRINAKLWEDYWNLIERSGEELDEFGMIKEKINFDERLKEIEERYAHIDWNTLFKLDWELFGDGKNNIVVGGMGTGKSNLILSLALACMERTNRYELVTNLGLSRGSNFDDIHHVSWMSDTLRIICENKINNLRLIDEGKEYEQKTIILVIDEAENLFQSIRSGSKEIADWNLIVNMFRKLQVSATYIFHRYKDVPAQIRTSPNLNSIVLKGCNLEGEPTNQDIDKVSIYFPKYNDSIKICSIPKCNLLDTNEYSSFAINEEDFPEKSINIKYILRMASDNPSDLAPKIILDYLDGIKVENFSNDEMQSVIKKISAENKKYLSICTTKTDYHQWIQKQFKDAFTINDISKVKGLAPSIKKIVDEDWSISRIEKNIPSIDPKTASIEELFNYLKIIPRKELKSKITDNGFREFKIEEYMQLEAFGIAKSKLEIIYGSIKDVISQKRTLKKAEI